MNPEIITGQLTTVNLITKDSTSNENSTAIDVRDYEGKIKLTLTSPGSDDANSNIAIALYAGSLSNGGSATDTNVAFTTFDNTAAVVESVEIDTRAVGRYLKAVVTHTGSNANGGVIAVQATGYKRTDG